MRSSSRLLLVIALVACSSTKTEKVIPPGIVELQRMLSAAQDLSTVASAGATKQQYEQRVTDALLKFGKPEQMCPHAVANLSTQEQKVFASQACQHLSAAMDAYVLAKEYLGPAHDPLSPDLEIYTLGQNDYAKVRDRIPSLEELPVAETNESGYKIYYRTAMLQALWKVAGQESEAAKGWIERLNHMW